MTSTPREKPTDAQRERLASFLQKEHGWTWEEACASADSYLAAGYLHRDEVEDALMERCKLAVKAVGVPAGWVTSFGLQALRNVRKQLRDERAKAALSKPKETDEHPYTDAEIAAEEPSND